jgi:hypothetical protein
LGDIVEGFALGATAAVEDAATQEASLEEAEKMLSKLADTLVDTLPAPKAGTGKGKGAADDSYQKQLKLVQELEKATHGGVETRGAQRIANDMLLTV